MPICIMRTDALSRILSETGRGLVGYYFTFCEYDFLLIAEMPSDVQMAAVVLAVGRRRRHRPVHQGGNNLGRGQGTLRRSQRSGASF